MTNASPATYRHLAMSFVCLASLVLAGNVSAQVSVIMIPKAPAEARTLVGSAEKFLTALRKLEQRPRLGSETEKRVITRARQLMSLARDVHASAQVGIPLSFLEEKSVAKDLKRVKAIVQFAVKIVRSKRATASASRSVAREHVQRG